MGKEFKHHPWRVLAYIYIGWSKNELYSQPAVTGSKDVSLVSTSSAVPVAQKVLLEIFYPDSRGVNVFVGGEKEPQMLLRLVRPTQWRGEWGVIKSWWGSG